MQNWIYKNDIKGHNRRLNLSSPRAYKTGSVKIPKVLLAMSFMNLYKQNRTSNNTFNLIFDYTEVNVYLIDCN